MTDVQVLDEMVRAELPASWRAELLAGWGEEWRDDTEASWLQPDDQD